MTRISCSEYSFPSVPGQDDRIAIVRALGFELVDLALFLADGSELVADPGAVAARLRRSLEHHGLASEDVFLAVGETVEEIAPNQRDPALREQGRRELAAAARVAAELGVPGLTILPGVTWAEDPDGAWACCVEELGWRVDEAARARGRAADRGARRIDRRAPRARRAALRGAPAPAPDARPLALRAAVGHGRPAAHPRAARRARARARRAARGDPDPLARERDRTSPGWSTRCALAATAAPTAWSTSRCPSGAATSWT